MDKKILIVVVLSILFIIAVSGLVLMMFQSKNLKYLVETSNSEKNMVDLENSSLKSQVSELNQKIALYSNDMPLSSILSATEAANKVINFINANYDSMASLISTQPKSGMYEVLVKFNGSSYTSYVTKDGAIFFTEGINLGEIKNKEFNKTTKPTIDLFVMAFCPYGNQAETSIIPVVNLFKNKISVNLHYIFYSNYGSKEQSSKYCYDVNRKYCSMHGIQELNQGIRELCVAKYSPDKLWTFIKSINDQASSVNVDSKWEAIATSLGIDVLKIKECYKNEAINLLASEVALTDKNYPVQDPSQNNGVENAKITGSPTLVINGMIYSGSRDSESVKIALCSAFKTVPIECQTVLSSGTSSSSGSCN